MGNPKFESNAAFGLPLEGILQPVLEDNLGHPLTKTASEFDTVDFVSEHRYAELKCRRPHHEKEEYNLWIFPMCKTLCKDKPVSIFYYWSKDESLYRIDYDEDSWFANHYNKGMPSGSTQMHWWVPKHLWTLVN